MKTAMCADIVTSPLFNVLHRVDPISANNKAIYFTLRNNRHNIYQHFYDSDRPSARDVLASNPFIALDVNIDGTVVREDVFLCLARDRKSKKIVEYFVSVAYNVVNDEYYRFDEKRGIFVFAYDDRKETVLIALAEEPAYVSPHAQNLVKLVHHPHHGDNEVHVGKYSLGVRSRCRGVFTH